MTEKEIAKLAELTRRTPDVRGRQDITPAALRFLQEAKPGLLALVQECRVQRQEAERLGRLAANTQTQADQRLAEMRQQVDQLKATNDRERGEMKIAVATFRPTFEAAMRALSLVRRIENVFLRGEEKEGDIPVRAAKFLKQFGETALREAIAACDEMKSVYADLSQVLDGIKRAEDKQGTLKRLVGDGFIFPERDSSEQPEKPKPKPASGKAVVCCPKCGNTAGPFRVKMERLAEVEQTSVGTTVKKLGELRVCEDSVGCLCGTMFSVAENVFPAGVLEKGVR